MKYYLSIWFIYFTVVLCNNSIAQNKIDNTISNIEVSVKKIQINEYTIVKDESDNILPYNIWNKLMLSGDYNLKILKTTNEEQAFRIVQLTENEKKLRQNIKPRESEWFKTGEKFSSFKTTDLYGNKINLKKLQGKILVFNFWFIKCMPCQEEIPQLNDLVDKYKNDSDVIFISIALDDDYSLKDFLKTKPFKYRIIDSGHFLTEKYGVKSYPTNLIVDRNGKVYFHSSGFTFNIGKWLDKSIEEIKLLKTSSL